MGWAVTGKEPDREEPDIEGLGKRKHRKHANVDRVEK